MATPVSHAVLPLYPSYALVL